MSAQAQPVQTQSEKERILRSLPQGTQRVQVRLPSGKIKFKRPDDVAPDDQIVLNGSGIPVTMRGRPGRRPQVVLEPVSEDVGEVMEARQEHIDTSDLVVTSRNNPDSDTVIDNVLSALAEEAAALEFERREAERHGRDTSNLSAKRARVLKGMGDLWMKRREQLQAGSIDLESPAFQQVFAFMLETVRGALEDAGMRAEHIETVFTKLSKRLGDTWNAEARARMKEKA